jgi:hypothetical protein
MAKAPDTRREELRTNLKTKHVYYFVDEDKGIDQKCREVFKNKKEIIHYPIGFDGGARYKTVTSFVFIGFDSNSSLPVGIQKSAKFGFGFTKVLAPLMDVLEDKMALKTIQILKTGKPSLSDNCLTITEAVLKKLYPIFKNILDTQKDDRLDLAKTKLHELFPATIKVGKKNYIPNSVNAALSSWSQVIDEFSDDDKEAIKDLFDKLSLTEGFLTAETLLKTKETLDQQYIEDVIDDYKKLMGRKNETAGLEKEWQSFLAKHNWVFSYIFSYPVMLVKKEAYVGGKNLSNKNGKVTDFLIKNSVTDNVAFLEIKTHRTKLLGAKKAYRGEDVFAMSSDVTGGIAQVLDQRDNFQKEYYQHKAKSAQTFETVNPKCVVLMGTIKDLSSNEFKSFELFRSNSKDVEIVTFDELLARFEALQKLMVSEK